MLKIISNINVLGLKQLILMKIKPKLLRKVVKSIISLKQVKSFNPHLIQKYQTKKKLISKPL